MINQLFFFLDLLNDWIWGYLGFFLIFGVGLYFSIASRFFYLRRMRYILASFFAFFTEKGDKRQAGIHPLKSFFAAIGGMIGIGNVAGICTAVQIGGPGALFWTWIGGLAGMLIQYAEVYLGIRYRVKNREGSYDGGPMYFLPAAYKSRRVASLVCLLLCLYGVEFFMFNVMANSISINWNLNEYWVSLILIIATIVVASGGIGRVGEICAILIPLFILSYVLMGSWVLFQNSALLPSLLTQIIQGAYTPQAAVGSFAGSSVSLTISMGLSRGAYSGDIGIGYTSVIYAESRTKDPRRIASLPIIGIILDTFVVCSFSIFLVLTTGLWNSGQDVTIMVQNSLALYFPYMHIFMPIFLFLLGYTTILAYLVAGVKCAKFLSPKWGPIIYYIYACITLPLFTFVEATQAFVVMSLAGAFLLILNLIGIFLLRKEVTFF